MNLQTPLAIGDMEAHAPLMLDPVLTKLAERRRNAERIVARGRAMVEQGTAELAECDRFEDFYRKATGTPAPTQSDLIMDSVLRSDPPRDLLQGAIRAQMTLKAAVRKALEAHPAGLESGQLLQVLRTTFPSLPRTSMSPQLSRMRAAGEVTNDNGLWKLKPKNNEATYSIEDVAK